MLHRRHLIALMASLPAAQAGRACAQADYPAYTVKVVVPWPAGGGTDVISRVLGEKLRQALGQPFVIENRPGASGNIGTAAVSKSTADGYTLVMATITVVITPHLTANAGYDPVTDLAPITLVASSPHILIVNPEMKVRSVADLIDLARSRPGELTYSSAGNGSPFHIAAELFNLQAGTKIRHIAYRGGAPAISDVVAGHVNLSFANLVAALPLIKGGQLRALGVTTATRSSAAPDIPTLAEAGLPKYEFSSWFGYFAPAGTPRPIIEKLDQEIRKALVDPEVQQRLQLDGAEPIAKGPAAFTDFLRSENAKWAALIRETGIRAD